MGSLYACLGRLLLYRSFHDRAFATRAVSHGLLGLLCAPMDTQSTTTAQQRTAADLLPKPRVSRFDKCWSGTISSLVRDSLEAGKTHSQG
jgi:hypothetical protein